MNRAAPTVLHPSRIRMALVALIALVVCVGGCSFPDTPTAQRTRHHGTAQRHHRTAPPPRGSAKSAKPAATPSTAGPSSAGPSSTGAAADPRLATARRRLAALKVTARPVSDGSYRRDAFGSSWADVDGDGCNQRDDVLKRDAVPGTITVGQQDSCDHDVLSGTWHDPYTGRMLTFTDLKDLHQAEAIQIDHVVPLGEAWYSGARQWSEERRERFANDLSELLAVDGPTNMSKSDDDPAAWRPRKGYQCQYAERWISVKSTWGLTVDASEVAALRQMLGYC